jgi:hypothetical protein
MPRTGDRLRYLLLFLLALTPRVIYGLVVMGHPAPDYKGDEMERAGTAVAVQGEIANVYSDTSGPSAHVSPLYPYFLAGLYRLAGPPADGGWMAQVLAASIATAAGIALIPLLALRLGFHPIAGWITAIFLALCPLNLWVESWGGWEQPFAVLALLGLLFVFLGLHRYWGADSQPDEPASGRSRLVLLVLAAGLLIGVSALLSPSLLPAAALMILGEFLAQARQRKSVLLAAGCMFAIAVACLAPWTIRNYEVLGGFIPMRSNFGLELWIGNNPQGNGKTFVTYFDDPNRITRQWHPAGSASERAHLQQVGEFAYMREKQHEALEWIGNHPGRFAELTANRFGYYWMPPEHMWSPSASMRAFRAPVYCLAGLGSFLCLAYLVIGGHGSRWLVGAALIGPSLVYLITHVDMRYRYLTFAISVLLTAHLVVEVGMRVGRHFGRSGTGAAGPRYPHTMSAPTI